MWQRRLPDQFAIPVYRAIFTALAMLISATPVFSQTDQAAPSSTTAALESLPLLYYSPLEHAGAHGITGWSLGVGVSMLSADNPATNFVKPEGDAPLVMRELLVTKGLLYPLDIGAGVSMLGGKPVRAAGYAQYTLFEALGFPAIATRLSGSKLLYPDLPESAASTALQGTLAASWGIGYLGVVGGLGTIATSVKTDDGNDVLVETNRGEIWRERNAWDL